ncbi:L-2-hydroxyglutarate oxidase [Rhizobium sp. Root482]|uniref:L-2-hydroxyglutarate oxidase n=1 Tax=Rhizobium sp. Root482 TaxID=1736543 RepID=UPI001910D6C4|nr:L-2-hydroxyglutarate oxidase [Rhizobium sp. Root482]
MHDFCVVGAGIVGLATAAELLRRWPDASVVVLEKEPHVAVHQTGHNSGVIHAGIYYKPGSVKADFCRRGAEATRDFCDQHAIAYETRGKLVVATTQTERQGLDQLEANAHANGIGVEKIDAVELRRREPRLSGLAALFVPETGIVDYSQLCDALSRSLVRAGGELVLGVEVEAISETGSCVIVHAGGRTWRTSNFIACAGLQSDRIARLAGLPVDYRIIPFRGEYYDVVQQERTRVHHLIYPVPSPDLPFLGIHLTPTIHGGLTAGPNAVLGLAREGYRRGSLDIGDVADYLSFPGFWRLLRRHWRSGLGEWKNSLSKPQYVAECRKFLPELKDDDLQPRAAGIRAQAVTRSGDLIHDFLFLDTARMVHVCNAPSPAATSAIPIARHIADLVQKKDALPRSVTVGRQFDDAGLS